MEEKILQVQDNGINERCDLNMIVNNQIIALNGLSGSKQNRIYHDLPTHEMFARGWDNTEGRWREVLWPRVCMHFYGCLEGRDHICCESSSHVHDDPGTKLALFRYKSSDTIQNERSPSDVQPPDNNAIPGSSRAAAADGQRAPDDEPALDSTLR